MELKLFLITACMGLSCVVCRSQEFTVIFDEEESAPEKDTVSFVTDVVSSDSIRIRLINKARQYMGASYKYGQSNENGFDCSGYVKYIYGQFGIDLPHSSIEQYHSSKRIKKNDVLPGDLVFFVTRGQKISHVGIYIGNNYFIHSPSKGKQVCVESLETDYFKKHLAGFGSVF